MPGQSTSSIDILSKKTFCAAICLLLIEFLAFGSTIRNSGFYFDDWATVADLHFGPADFLSQFQHFLTSDTKISIRPIQGILLTACYQVAGTNQGLYHALNCTFEFIAALLMLILCNKILTQKDIKGGMSYVAAVTLLLYPFEDSVHNWMLCIALSFSRICVLWSMIVLAGAVAKRSYARVALSTLPWALMIFNYEVFVPALALGPMILALGWRQSKVDVNFFIKGSLLLTTSGCVQIVLLILWQKFAVPLLGGGWLHAISFDPGLMWQTVSQGIRLNCPDNVMRFAWQQAKLIDASPYNITAAVTVGLVTTLFLAKCSPLNDFAIAHKSRLEPIAFAVIGLTLLPLTYTIFGLNAEYVPAETGLLSRINAGAGLALSFFIAGLYGLCISLKGRRWLLICALTTGALFSICTALNIATQKPWETARVAQKEIRSSLEKLSQTLPKAKPIKGLILAGCAPYVIHVPVFDGVWDFGGFARLVLNSNDIRATTVSARLIADDNRVRDMVGNIECQKMGYDGLYLFNPSASKLQLIENLAQLKSALKSLNPEWRPSNQTIDNWNSSQTTKIDTDASL